ncbi:unnamed protein product [Anisakis simplex]|uniref:DUF3060 domain-containing protein n=1 Tax=Anisakis simplex TaxID=6269 RepID=A0A0M3JXB6_ANISI|nr:unnamed protein product [Anisakis simplex]
MKQFHDNRRNISRDIGIFGTVSMRYMISSALNRHSILAGHVNGSNPVLTFDGRPDTATGGCGCVTYDGHADTKNEMYNQSEIEII